jgi:Enoyl-(Acyl carrier protein) reductase
LVQSSWQYLPTTRDKDELTVFHNTKAGDSYCSLSPARPLPYGATKSALESMSAVWATELRKFKITVNVLVPGGPTDTSLIAEASGWPRDQFLRPEIMGPPACWLVSDESNDFTGQRITAKKWNEALPGIEAAKNASRAIGWPEIADQPADWQNESTTGS